jgi:O-antigen/teichoic acid export membrane protein
LKKILYYSFSRLTKIIKLSVIHSSVYSILASICSYLLILFLAKNYSQEDVSSYLLITTWAVLLNLILDCASDQTLVHYSKVKNYPIEVLWKKVAKLKLFLFFVIFTSSYFLEIILLYDFKQTIIFMIAPSFYMGVIYEYYGRNVDYARIIFFEKLIILMVIFIASLINKNIYIVIYCYFIITFSIFLWQYISCINQNAYLHDKDSVVMKNYVANYFQIYLVLLSQIFYGNISRLIIELKLGVIAFASTSLAFQITNSISIIQYQVDRHIRAKVIDAVHSGNICDLNAIILRYLFFYLLPIASGCVFISLFSRSIVSLLFGEKWLQAADVLTVSSPLLLTVACLRFIDVMVISMGISNINLKVNICIAALLFLCLWYNPWSSTLVSYIYIIVFTQFVHVAIMSFYVYVHFLDLIKRGLYISSK